MSSAPSGTTGATNRKLRNLDGMISVAERRVRAAAGPHRKFRRDGTEKKLPQGHGRASTSGDGKRASVKWAGTRSDRSDTQRGAPKPFHQSLLTAGQRYGDGQSDRLHALVDA